nr:DUF1592 domain-containing protein [Myxococcota bacterium]
GVNTAGGMRATGGSVATATGGKRSNAEWFGECTGADTLRLQRLTASDIERTLEDLFGSSGTRLGRPWPLLRQGGRGSVTVEEARALARIARERAQEYSAAHADECPDALSCRPNLADLGLRLFRRPLSQEESAAFEMLFERAAEEASDPAAGLSAVVEAMLESPYFVFRVETSSGGRWSDWTVAARLAYFLWRSGPDAELRNAATRAELSDREGLERQVARMLDDPRAAYGFAAIVEEWLGLAELGEPGFAVWPAEVPIAEMAQQTQIFLERAYAEDRATLDELLLATQAPLNAPLADYLRVPSDGLGARFSDVELEPSKFAGILTHGALLLTAGTPSTRGKLLLGRLLCTEVGASPPSVDLPEGNTRRERYEALSSTAACAGCHQMLDPLGFALEGFDSLGAPQDALVNGSIAQLDGASNVPFDGPRGLAELLAGSPQVSRCLGRRFGEYALDGGQGQVSVLQSGTPLPPAGEPPAPPAPLTCLASAFEREGGDLRSLLAGLARSDVFLRASADFELPSFRASERTPLEHAAGNADALARAAAQSVDSPLEIQSYAEALAALAREDAP